MLVGVDGSNLELTSSRPLCYRGAGVCIDLFSLGKESRMPQRREAAIVGIYEYPLRVAPGISPLQIKAESAAKA